MVGDEGGIFSKAPDWKCFFLLKMKIKQNPGCSNKEYDVILAHTFIWGKRGLGEQDWFVLNTVEIWEESPSPENLAIFPLISACKHYYQYLNWHKYEHLFFLKSSKLIINRVPLCLLQTYCARKTILEI